MQLTSSSFFDGAPIPAEFAFARIDPANHVALSDNRNPHLAWSDPPAGAQSFVLICHDCDVPSRGDDVNQEDREVPRSLPRVDFFHWILLDIPATSREIAAGSHSDGVTPRGKNPTDAPDGLRHGLNDFTAWFAADPQMRGLYHGYDGPAPPWNDAMIHHYNFNLYALDIPRLEIKGDLTGAAVHAALDGHILGVVGLVGVYTLNPRLVV
jgi:Raf kinase inhibitor-like YbhB/YbcL family protein